MVEFVVITFVLVLVYHYINIKIHKKDKFDCPICKKDTDVFVTCECCGEIIYKIKGKC